MLFVSFLSPIGGTAKGRAARRLDWQYPEDVRFVGEYWLQSSDPSVVVIFEAEDALILEKMRGFWTDLFDINIIPAITGDEGIKLVLEMMEGKDL